MQEAGNSGSQTRVGPWIFAVHASGALEVEDGKCPDFCEVALRELDFVDVTGPHKMGQNLPTSTLNPYLGPRPYKP